MVVGWYTFLRHNCIRTSKYSSCVSHRGGRSLLSMISTLLLFLDVTMNDGCSSIEIRSIYILARRLD